MIGFRDLDPPERFGYPRSRYVIDCAGAQVYVHARSVAAVLRIDGEIDMANADLVTQAVRRFSRLKAPLIVDLSHLDFLGIAGFRTLLVLNREREQAQLHCSVVNGATLRRLTRVVTDQGLPIVESVPEALGLIEEASRTRRQHVDGMARQREPQRDGSEE